MRKNRTFWIAGLSLASSAFLFVQMGLYAAHACFGIHLKYNLFDLCTVFFGILGMPYIRTVMSVLVWCTLVTALWFAVKTVYNTSRAYRRISVCRHSDDSAASVEQDGALTEDCLLVTHHAPAAFTIGLFQPKIVLTTGLLELLDPSEVQAVIHHEHYHQRHRDPLVIFLLEISSKSMWYIPVFKWVSEMYKVAAEIMADKHAIQLTGGSKSLGSALLKMLKIGQPSDVMLSSASYASFAQSSINLRILHIMNPHMKMVYKPPVIRCIISIIGFCLLALLI